ncbi:MAG: hypothetical protein IT372_03610, partial [Polyangiaceae bacterium]|nr:hypothetical protein [Polyangiaceae bacterium]
METRAAAMLGVAMLAAWGAGCWPFVVDQCELRCPSGATSTGAGGGGGTGGAGGGSPATDRFVDPVAGDDAGPGTEEQPLKTLKQALSIAR